MLLLALIAAAGGLLMLALWGNPRRALVVWLLSLTMVPIWISIHLLIAVPLVSIVSVLAIVSTIFQARITFSKYDAYFTVFIAVAIGVLAASGVDAHAIVIVLVRWALPFVTARLLVSMTGTRFAVDAIALVFGAVGALAVVELVLDWHPFTTWSFGSMSGYQTWSGIQLRDGQARSEWAFGHSIALGGGLVLALPFVVRSSYSLAIRSLLLIVIGAGVVAAGSRSGVVAAVLTAGILFINAPGNQRLRPIALALASAGALLTAAFLLPILQKFALGKSRGDQSSALYRGQLFENFLPRIEWFGPYDVYAPGENAERSIDSAIIDIGLRYGWMVLILATVPLLICSFKALAGTASTAEMALAGQIPLIATVALINQYELLLFFVAGLAVTILIESRTSEAGVAAPAAGTESLALRR